MSEYVPLFPGEKIVITVMLAVFAIGILSAWTLDLIEYLQRSSKPPSNPRHQCRCILCGVRPGDGQDIALLVSYRRGAIRRGQPRDRTSGVTNVNVAQRVEPDWSPSVDHEAILLWLEQLPETFPTAAIEHEDPLP